MEKTVVITGASSGIGAALAERYAKAGWNVVLIARRRDRLEEIAKRCGVKAKILVADVTQKSFENDLTTFLERMPGDLFHVYANAGAGAAGRTDKLNIEDYERHFAVNVFGVLRTLRGAQSKLKSSKGRFIIIGSLNSYLAFPLGTPYNMGKFAVRALAESLFAEEPTLGFSCSVVCPGPIATELLSKNNKGEAVQLGDDFPKIHALSPAKAADRIFKKVLRGRREIFLSMDSFVLVALHRHFPSFTSRLIRIGYGLFSAKALKLVGMVNPDSI